MQKAEVGSRSSFAPSPASAGGASEGFGPQAGKTQNVKQGANGPILRSGPIRSVAQLRPAEPSQSGNISEASTQALKLDAKSVIEQERASAEVGIAPPIASGREGVGTDERPARPRMPGTVIRTFGGLKV